MTLNAQHLRLQKGRDGKVEHGSQEFGAWESRVLKREKDPGLPWTIWRSRWLSPCGTLAASILEVPVIIPSANAWPGNSHSESTCRRLLGCAVLFPRSWQNTQLWKMTSPGCRCEVWQRQYKGLWVFRARDSRWQTLELLSFNSRLSGCSGDL